ncbi:cytochrome P450, partial [Mycena olivaceomarginata]
KDGERVDVFSGLRRMTLDVIGKAGFNHDLDTLEVKGRPSELNEAFTKLLYPLSGQAVCPRPTCSVDDHCSEIAGIIHTLRPSALLLTNSGSQSAPWGATRNAQVKMDGIATQTVMESKANANLEGLDAKRDLVSGLFPCAEIPTFFVARHKTTRSSVSTSLLSKTYLIIATAWVLHALSQHTAVQVKLCNELLNLSADSPSMEELNSLPNLETVVREVMLRFRNPTLTKAGKSHNSLVFVSPPDLYGSHSDAFSRRISKGQMIHIPILAVGMDTEIWGEDVREFKPERWESLPDAVILVPGVWANLLTSFAGTTNYIGPRFSLVEHVLKALLFTLIRVFEFEAAVPKGGIRHTSTRFVALGAPALHGSYRLALCGISIGFGVGSCDRGLHNLNAHFFLCFFSESHIHLATVGHKHRPTAKYTRGALWGTGLIPRAVIGQGGIF